MSEPTYDRGGCECAECRITPHWSDCAVHNEPALPKELCDCGATALLHEQAEPLDGSNE
jgi:hypothetical protein